MAEKLVALTPALHNVERDAVTSTRRFGGSANRRGRPLRFARGGAPGFTVAKGWYVVRAEWACTLPVG